MTGFVDFVCGWFLGFGLLVLGFVVLCVGLVGCVDYFDYFVF